MSAELRPGTASTTTSGGAHPIMAPITRKPTRTTRNKPARRPNGAQGKKTTFVSSRTVDRVSDQSECYEEDSGHVGDLSETSSSDGEAAPDQAYSLLLQDLMSRGRNAQPPRKKRKVSSEAEPTKAMVPGGIIDDTTPIQEDPKSDVADLMEPEETRDAVVTETVEDDPDDDGRDPSDPFEVHFSSISSDILARGINDVVASNFTRSRCSFTHYLNASVVQPASEIMPFVQAEAMNTLTANHAMFLKARVRPAATELLERADMDMKSLSRLLFEYRDLLFCTRTVSNSESLRRLYCMHALNHVLKTRDTVIKHNALLAKATPEDDVEYRDQGFARPKVLILLPTRQACFKAVEALLQVLKPEQQENKSRLADSFSFSSDVISPDKPEDFRELFAGNDDDMFRLGIKLTRKAIKFFSNFYNSDIILASPLGLRMAVGDEGSKEFDRDFLTSIEVVIIDHADALLMQNWEHTAHVLEHLSAQPKEAHGCDFSRVRDWYLEGNSRYLRQTVVLSSFNTPELNQVFNTKMLNVAGRFKLDTPTFDGVIRDIGFSIKQTFSRFDAPSVFSDPDSRFKYFTNTLFPTIKKNARSGSTKSSGILLFIPSYMDFVRVRNFLANSVMAQDISFGAISEYTSVAETARARSHFFYGRHALLLYTGRAHHFRRYKVRGVKKVFMYALPDNPLFYKAVAHDFLAQSISEGLIDQSTASIRALFSKWDCMKLERVVGTAKIVAMTKGKGATFEFA